MKITEMAFTGYSVTDMKRARSFYEGFLGLKKSRGFGELDGEDQWVEYDIGTGCLALVSGGGKEWPPAAAGTAAALEVDDISAYGAEIEKCGIKVVFPLRESPQCWMIVIADPDGNWVVLHQRKTT